ncbi:MAG: hypothetical protein EP346_02215 [Bacteroidetes bacterium]|uniref:Carboxypeptidase regulatory-like domain-containing protein n=1 Tax=Phaeocystidibacter marisrubri TaxID=1577780 RepID=A0A6L3ZGD3_9FLAO|nr:hypothetical protein [Phaeocystidibacter marisrubri]KAB2816512.1 hypothetical protein F8C82_12590 [Phaeocystidibacter marisrubri]TNE31013.1 MAG: hypothetical protein EP346_02215 [Bacteroidota bacterium]
MRKLLTVLFLGSMALLSGCNRSEGNPEGTAIVYVVNSEGEPIQNALVQFISPDNSPNGIEVYKYTDIDGSAFVKWNYDIFVDVTATKGGFKGCNAIHIVPGETTTGNVIIKPFGSNSNGCP